MPLFLPLTWLRNFCSRFTALHWLLEPGPLLDDGHQVRANNNVDALGQNGTKVDFAKSEERMQHLSMLKTRANIKCGELLTLCC